MTYEQVYILAEAITNGLGMIAVAIAVLALVKAIRG